MSVSKSRLYLRIFWRNVLRALALFLFIFFLPSLSSQSCNGKPHACVQLSRHKKSPKHSQGNKAEPKIKASEETFNLVFLMYLVEVILQVGQQANVERWNSFFIYNRFALEERSTQLLKLLQTLGHVSNFHGIADGLDQVCQLLKP